MDWLKRRTGRGGPAFLAVLVVGLLLNASSSLTSATVNESSFTNLGAGKQPVGVATSLGRLLVTLHCSTQVLSIDSSTGVPSPFATLLAQDPATCEDYIAIVPAQANFQSVRGYPTPFFNGFTSNDVYVTQGPNVTKIPFDKTKPPQFAGTPSLFATLPCPASANGITFDQVGTFGHNMIVACSDGSGVFLLNGSGQTVKVDGAPTNKPIATISITTGQIVEGPEVAPLTFGSFGGQLLVTVSPINPAATPLLPPGNVFAINPKGTGKPSPVGAWPSAESVRVIPTTKCTFGLSSATYFSAGFGTNTVYSLPLGTGVFNGLGDGQHALVTSEGGASNNVGTALLTSTGGTSTFVPFVTEHQGSAFVNCATPLLMQCFRTEASFNVGPGANGVLDIFCLQESNFNPLTICVGTTTADGSQPCLAPVPRAGVTGTEQSFKEAGKSLVASGRGAAIDIKVFKSLLSATAVNGFDGPIFIKLNYLGPIGDPDAEGDG